MRTENRLRQAIGFRRVAGSAAYGADLPSRLYGHPVPKITLNPDAVVELELEGAITISAAAELKRSLREAVATGRPISISLERVTDLNITAIQLLWAAARDARDRGLDFRFKPPLPPPVLHCLEDLGIAWECAS